MKGVDLPVDQLSRPVARTKTPCFNPQRSGDPEALLSHVWRPAGGRHRMALRAESCIFDGVELVGRRGWRSRRSGGFHACNLARLQGCKITVLGLQVEIGLAQYGQRIEATGAKVGDDRAVDEVSDGVVTTHEFRVDRARLEGAGILVNRLGLQAIAEQIGRIFLAWDGERALGEDELDADAELLLGAVRHLAENFFGLPDAAEATHRALSKLAAEAEEI